MRTTPLFCDDFLKSLAFGRKEFETEEELIDCFEEYVKEFYEWELNSPTIVPVSETKRYIYRTCEEGITLYYEKLYDAIRLADRNLRTEFIAVPKNSQEFRIAHTNSTRRDIECMLRVIDLKFMIGGELRAIEYFGEPLGFRDIEYE